MLRALVSLVVLAPLTANAETCVSIADGQKTLAAARQKAESSFAAALAQKKLAIVKLGPTSWGDAGDEDDAAPTEPKADSVVQHAGASVVVFGRRRPNCSYDLDELVQQGSKIFRVVRKPHVTKTTTVAICDCEVIQYRCGGANMRPETYGYILPAKTTYGGPIEVAYDAETISAKYAVGRTKPCVRPAPPP